MDQRDYLQAQMMAKSTGIAAVLTLFFGGFGLLYVTIIGGIIGSIVEVILFAFVVFTAGIGFIVYLPWHIFCVVVALILTSMHNKHILRNLDAKEVSANEITNS